jgi:hypothetical protein
LSDATPAIPGPYRPCVRCGRGTLVRVRLTNPDTGEPERLAVCLACAVKMRREENRDG